MSRAPYRSTARDIAEQLAAPTSDDLADAYADAAPDPATPHNGLLFGQRLPDIGAWSERDIYDRPATRRAFGEPREDQQ